METFGTRLRAAREACGITQETVGFELGVTNATVSKWETGRSEPTLTQLAVLANLLGRSTDYFLRPEVASVDFRNAPDARRALNMDEERFLVRFRAISAAKRQGIIALMAPDTLGAAAS